ncbi:hypothetical protein ABZ471_33810 [Streptomyces sp. NPDC005728]|uniref:hypothetical protein n=1 Tax=Streptomyces sp. NPDC005728 TaxID=3157054 RepID=UPI0033F3A6B4
MKPTTGDEARGALWPASCPGTSRARIPAHALAVLAVVTAVCGASQVSDQYRAAALDQGMPWMLVPILLMCTAPPGALLGLRGVPYGLLTALA